MGRVCTGSMVAGTAVTPACPRHRRFCITFLWEWVCWQWEGWWQKSGLVRTLQKKGPLTLRGKATEGNTLGSMALGTGEMQDDATGQGCGSDASSSSLLSNLHCISSGLGVLAEVRTGQDTTKKKGPLT